jgi:hypothetical protein
MPVYQFIFNKGQGPREAQSKIKKLLIFFESVEIKEVRYKNPHSKEKRIHLSFIRY